MREIKNGHSPRPLSQADVTVTVMTVRKKKKGKDKNGLSEWLSFKPLLLKSLHVLFMIFSLEFLNNM